MKPLQSFFPTRAKFSPLPQQIFPWKADTSSWIIYSIRFQVLLASIAHSFWMDNKQQSNESIKPPSKSTMNLLSGQILKSAISSQQLLWNPTPANKESKNWKKVKLSKINESTLETTWNGVTPVIMTWPIKFSMISHGQLTSPSAATAKSEFILEINISSKSVESDFIPTKPGINPEHTSKAPYSKDPQTILLGKPSAPWALKFKEAGIES